MASASLQRANCSRLDTSALEWTLRRSLAAAAAGCVLVAALMVNLPPAAGSLLLICLLCVAWQFHLRSRGLPWYWCVPLAALLIDQLFVYFLFAPQLATGPSITALAHGTLAYLMFWTLSMRNQRGLQPVASVALLLALSLFGHPSMVAAGLAVSLALWLSLRRRLGGCPQSAVLIFTPAALSILFTSFLRVLGIALIRCPILDTDFLQLASWHYTPVHPVCLHSLGAVLVFALGSLLSRLLDGSAGMTDLSCAALLAIFIAGEILIPITDSAALLDIDMIVAGAAMSLVAAQPPRRRVSRAFLAVVAVAAFVANAAG